MSSVEVILLALALSMDAFAVSVCCGLAVPSLRAGRALTVGGWFGGFQGLMPLLGCLCMSFCTRLFWVAMAAPFIAAALLLGIGGNMLWESLRGENTAVSSELRASEMILLALATSIDAMASGLAMACRMTLPAALCAVAVIGAVTFAVCSAGACLGHFLGHTVNRGATLAGALTLLALGVKFLLEAFGVI